MSRLNRERKTIAIMIALYCRDHHEDVRANSSAGECLDEDRKMVKSGPCPDCRELLEYSERRLERCRFGEDKPTCAHCTVHCYARTRREQIRAVMRYSGPRMTSRHPILAVAHLVDSARSRRRSARR